LGARGDSLLEDRVGIVRDKDHACGSSAECFGTEVFVLGRLVSNFPQRPYDDWGRSTAAGDEAPPPLTMTPRKIAGNHSATREPATRESHSGTAAASRDAGVRFLHAARAAGRAGRHFELAVRLLPCTRKGVFRAKGPTRCTYKTPELELA
jgi:hypothetical protein